MHRTQLTLRDEQYQFLATCAKQKGKSINAVLREMIDNQMGEQASEQDPLESIIGMAEGEDAHIGRDHDRYLYGSER